MKLIVENVSIYGLFGNRHYDIDIFENKGVLVAPNGSGKSNILQLVTFFLGRQWARMLEISFDYMTIEINGNLFTVSRRNIAQSMYHLSAISQTTLSFKRTAENVIFDLAARGILSQIVSGENENYGTFGQRRWQITQSVSEALACDSSISENVVRTIQTSILSLHPSSSDVIGEGDLFDALVEDYTIMYLPTYRRIEKDIRFLFGEPSARAALSFSRGARTKPEFFVELVDFGMNDVRKMLGEIEEKLRLEALSTVWGLSGQYLVDVVSGVANRQFGSSIENLSLERLEAIIDRSRKHLPFHQVLINKIMDTVARLRSDDVESANDYYVAHYIKLLIDADRKIRQAERPARNFVRICNNYLVNKLFKFASDTSTFHINDAISEGDNQIDLQFLSSGEKQIVSLFAHLTFGDKPILLFIDEPELSLSIDWQQKFLPDIWQTKRCEFIFASTHSPFLYENEFDNSAIDLISRRIG